MDAVVVALISGAEALLLAAIKVSKVLSGQEGGREETE